MAKVISKVLGKFSGSLGDMSLRNRKGTNYIAMKPGSFNVPIDENSVLRRLRFSYSVKLAAAINSFSLIKKAWAAEQTAEMTTANLITQTNYKLMDTSGLTDLNVLLPAGGFPFSVKSFTIADGKITIVINPLINSTHFDLSIEKNLHMFCIHTLIMPSINSLPCISFIKCEFVQNSFTLEEEYIFIYNLTQLETGLLEKYSQRKSYSALITTDQTGSIIHYSQTVTN